MQKLLGGLVVLVLFLACHLSVSADTVIYENDFESPVGDEWSSTDTSVTPIGERKFLGEFGTKTVSLSLPNIPTHQQATISFDLFILKTWDGNQLLQDETFTIGPDIWDLRLGSDTVLLHTTFSNHDWLDWQQAYPGQYPGGNFLAKTGAVESNTLGYWSGPRQMDSVYHLSFTFPHSADFIIANFSAILTNFRMSDESWGLDNVSVSINPVPEPCSAIILLSGIGMLSATFLRRYPKS